MQRLGHRTQVTALLAALAVLTGCLEGDRPMLPVAHQPATAVPALTLLAPNGGEVWTAGESCAISWETFGPADAAVRLELLLGDVPCRTLSDSTANDGTFTWTPFPCQVSADGYHIRISALGSGIWDVSDAPFAIEPEARTCTLTLTAPEGPAVRGENESWLAGDSLWIAWEREGSGCGDTVRIELLHDQEPCLLLADLAGAQGGLLWVVEPCGVATGGYGLRVTDLTSGATDATSAGCRILPAPPQPMVNVLIPDGGEIWIEGEQRTILWDSSGICADACTSAVRIELLHGGLVAATIASQAPNHGTYAWTVDRGGTDGDSLRIRITDLATLVADESDDPFTILPPDLLTVAAPNGGEVWVEGEEQTIVWGRGSDPGESVRIELLQGELPCALIADDAPNSGSFIWLAERCGEEQSGYRVRITDLTDQGFDVSDGPFSVLAPCAVHLLAPNGGEAWIAGEVRLILWDVSAACGAAVRIELEQGGSICRTIAAAAPNTGSYIWTVDPCAGSGTGYRILVTDLGSGAVDGSDGAFGIVEPCVVTVLEPHGGEAWIAGETRTLSWRSDGACGGPVKIELLRGGTVCQRIADSTPDDGRHFWSVQQCGGEVSGYRVRVTHLASGAGGLQAGTISINSPCTVRLLAPRGGERWVEESEYEITWLTSGACGSGVQLELLRDGVVCEVIARGLSGNAAGLGQYTWMPRRCGGRENGYQIRISDPESGVQETSPGPFSILSPCEVQVLAPNGGEQWVAGERYEIRWQGSPTCSDRVAIDLLCDGVRCGSVAGGAANSGRLLWDAVAAGDRPDRYRLVVRDLATDGADTSDTEFRIDPPVFLRFAFSAGGVQLTTNNPAWQSAAHLEFQPPGSHSIGCGGWVDCGCDVLLLEPGSGGAVAFFPTEYGPGDGRAGLSVAPACTGIQLDLRGEAEGAGSGIELRVSAGAGGTCGGLLPILTQCQTHSVLLLPGCIGGDGVVKMDTEYAAASSEQRRYAVSEVEYTFHGWAIRE